MAAHFSIGILAHFSISIYIKITNIHRVLILRRNLWLIMMLSLLLIGI
jgi:hypothetical protein